MTSETCILVGAPMDSGKARKGCLMGPDAYRTAGLAEALRGLGHGVEDRGNVQPRTFVEKQHPKLVALQETIAWTNPSHQHVAVQQRNHHGVGQNEPHGCRFGLFLGHVLDRIEAFDAEIGP